ncbi:MAG: molybdopterin molybdotransferase MoeA [Anaerolineae bacterium]|nr:molybdopterin molybdotransferase MoeA [Anaerolineae bacterium]
MAPLLDVHETLQRILADFQRLSPESIPLPDALDRVLAEPIRASTALPPFANSSMDGFAVVAADTSSATADSPARLPVVMDIPAGSAPERALTSGTAARIMTGAPLPPGADAVIPMEDTSATWQAGDPPPAEVAITRPASPGANIRPAGEDIPAGERVLPAGAVIGPPEIGVLAALGHATVPVVRQPVAAVIATGDELLEPGEALTPGKIRNSNSYVLEALIRQAGARALRLPIARDTPAAVRALFDRALAHQPDIILSSGGVSVGAHDVVRHVLDTLGEVRIWRVNMRPGKPLAYGKVRSVPFFGLPGNPVSAQVTFDVFVRPALLKLAGRPNHTPIVEAILDETLDTDGRLTYFRVQLRQDESGMLHATSTGTQSSGALRSMVLADGLLIVPAGESAAAGGRYRVRLLRPQHLQQITPQNPM